MLQNLLNVTIVVFMVGNLLEVGLRLNVAEALAALRNARFVVLTLLWCFVLGPALAVLLTKIIPLAEPYALGLVLLGLAPCSPAIPMMVKKTGGSLAYMSASGMSRWIQAVDWMDLTSLKMPYTVGGGSA
jgi:bile acid:Na+ symporter, BASS family